LQSISVTFPRLLVTALLSVPLVAGSVSAQSPAKSPSEKTSSRQGQRISIEGLAEFRQADLLLVSGYRLRATPETKFLDPAITSLDAVPLGFRVEAKGAVQPDGTIVLQELEAAPRKREDAGRGVVSGALDQEGKWLNGSGSIFRAALASNTPERRAPKTDPQYERVRNILVRMVPGSLDESLRLHIVNSPDWNARGLPNGSIAVASGLLSDMDDDEVAIVLGHELAHVTHEHAQKTLADAERRKLVTSLISDLIPEGGFVTQVALTVGGAVALKAWQSGYSRSLETEADRVGLSYAAVGGFDIRKAPRVWERFQQKYGSENTVKNFIVGSHPRNVERVKNALQELRYYYPNYVPGGPPVSSMAAATPGPALPSIDADTSSLPALQLASGATPAVASPPPSIEITKGMTQEQVRALLGAPKEELVFTANDVRQTKWVFAHLKVTFVDGRVTAVEF
jgi:Zn-dependent protease with chaperone function